MFQLGFLKMHFTESGMCTDWVPAAVTRVSDGKNAAPTGSIAGDC